MKFISRSALVCACLFLFTFIAQAQQPSTTSAWASNANKSAATADANAQSKIVLMDSRAFYDEKSGIQKLVQAYKQLNNEFAPRQKELQMLQAKIEGLISEVNKMGTVAPDVLAAKREEGERLQREYEYKKNDAQSAFAKREKEIVTPVFALIGKAMEDFMRARNITFILDVSKMGESLLAALPTADVTNAFIDDYNAKNPLSTAAK